MAYAVKVLNAKQFNREIAKRLKAIEDKRPLYTNALVLVDRWIQKNFQGEGDKVGGWAPLAPATIAWKKKHGYERILQNTGKLRSEWKRQVTNRRAYIQSGQKYGGYHQKGGPHLPQRRILPENEEIWPELLKLFEHYLGKKFK